MAALSTDPPQGLVHWLQEQLGPLLEVQAAAGITGGVQTWRVQAGDRRSYYCRDGLSPRKFQQEQEVAARLWPLLGEGCPRLMGADGDGGRLLMTACPGQPSPQSAAAWTAAGAQVRALHALPHDDRDALAPRLAVLKRLKAAARALGPVEASRVRAAVELVGDGAALGDQPRRWCHRDLRADNWLWDGTRLSLVDWEHARPDLPVLDLVLPASAGAGRWAAFVEGYGAVDAPALRAARVVYGLATLAWGHRHGQPDFCADGRRILDAALTDADAG